MKLCHLAVPAFTLSAILGFTQVSNAGILRVTADNFLANSGLITFSEFAIGTENPTYTPGDYGGDAGSPTVSTTGWFLGQSLSADPAADCPGAAASGCIIGTPTGPLSLDAGARATYITNDIANPTSPVLSGTPRYSGGIALLFDADQIGVGFDGGSFNTVGSTGITAFRRDGSLIGTVENTMTRFEFLGLASADGLPEIAGVFLDLIGVEPGGFAIDNVRFADSIGEIEIPAVPLPGAAILFLTGLAGMAGFKARKKA